MAPKRSNTPSQAKKAPSTVATGAAGKRKKLSFDETTLKAATSAIQTTDIGTATPTPVATKAGKASNKPTAKPSTPAAAAAKKKVVVADMKGSGIVKAKQAKKRAEAAAAAEEEEKEDAVAAPVHSDDSSEDDEADMLRGSDDGDSLSDVADRPSSDDDDEDADSAAAAAKRKAAAAHKAGARATEPYKAVRLSFLPAEFQEPQLYKFLNQFGATVLNCFCVRSKRTHRSKGVAYVEFDKESVIPLVVEECNGMVLGGMSVRARPVTMHRAMPSRKMVTRRRALAYAYRTKGAPLKKHDVSKKSVIALLIKAARTEKANNAHLRKLGVDFQSDFFQSQLKAMPAGLLRKRTRTPKAAKKSTEAVAVKKAAPKAAAKAVPKPAAKATPKAAAKATPKAAAKVSPKLSPKVSPKVAPKVSPKVAPKVSPKAAPKAAAKKAPRPAAKKAAPKKK